MSKRTALIALVVLVTLIALHQNLVSIPTYANMASSSGKPSVSYLVFSVAQVASPFAPKLAITLTNNHPTATFTVLTWDTPLENQGQRTLTGGILHIVDQASKSGDEELKVDRIMLNRKLPPPVDALVELAPGKSTRVEITIDSPLLPTLTKGKDRYAVYVAGAWKAVWAKSKAEVSEDERSAMGGDDDVLVGDFKSEKVVIDVE